MSSNQRSATPIDPARRRLLQLGWVMTGFYAVVWGLQFVFKGNWLPAAVAVVATTIAGVYIVRPGWNIVPHRINLRIAVLFAVIIASGVIAAVLLAFSGIQTPYDGMQFNFIALIPLMSAFAALEELLYRQVIYRWLEQGHLSDRAIILATATAWGCGHLGSVFAQPYVTFSLLQSLYLVWIGVLLGELRRTSGSWPVAWAGHVAYNVTVLFVLSFIE